MAITILILLLIIIPAAVFLFFAFAPQIGARAVNKTPGNLQNSPRYLNGQFQNVIETSVKMPFRTIIKTLYEVLKGDKERLPAKAIETTVFDGKQFDNVGNEETAAISWFGHSSLLIKMHGKVFLTDPVLVNKRASMISFIGPKRFSYTNYVQVSELPYIDAVLISHDHYDHLDYATIRMLTQSIKKFIVPLGVGAHLERWGIHASYIFEYDWWNEFEFDENITLSCMPSRHFSGRSLTGRNGTLWCSWIVSGKKQRIYFGADSGYSPSFKEIGARYGPFDLTILECGAYSKYWPAIHMMPEETIQAHIDLNGKMLMPVHWAKYNLSLHGWKEPIKRLQTAALLKGVQIVTPKIGSILHVDNKVNYENWWTDV